MRSLQKNIGKSERAVRIIVGVLLLMFAFGRALTAGLTALPIIFGIVGVVLLVTGAVSY